MMLHNSIDLPYHLIPVKVSMTKLKAKLKICNRQSPSIEAS